MKKILFCMLLSGAALMTNGCGSVRRAPSEEMGPDVYRISAWSTSRKVLAETVESAKARCAKEDKQYLFVKNIFQYGCNLGIDMISYELYFSCVEAGDSRLKEWKSPLGPGAAKTNQAAGQAEQKIAPDKESGQGKPDDRSGREGSPAPEQVVPDKKKPQAQASPAKDQAKSADSPGKAASAPAQLQPPPKDEPQAPQEATPAVSEEQRRKGNPGMGEPENLRKDGSSLCDEAGQNVRIIEEPLYK